MHALTTACAWLEVFLLTVMLKQTQLGSVVEDNLKKKIIKASL